MGFWRCRGNPARHLAIGDTLRQPGKRLGLVIPGLCFERWPINRPAIKPGWCPSLEACERQAQTLESQRKTDRWRIVNAPSRVTLFADMDLTTQEGAGGDNGGPTKNALAVAGNDRGQGTSLVKFQPFSPAGHNGEARLSTQQRLHCLAIKSPIRLGTRPPNGWPLGQVEHLDVNSRCIRGAGHNAIKRINFAHQVALAHPANSRVAGHFPNGFNLMGQQKRARTTTRRGRRSLTAGVATAHNHNIKGQIRARHVPPISALLADTEVPEDDIENFLNTHAPRQAAKGEKGRAQRLRRQLRKAGALRLGQ